MNTLGAVLAFVGIVTTMGVLGYAATGVFIFFTMDAPKKIYAIAYMVLIGGDLALGWFLARWAGLW